MRDNRLEKYFALLMVTVVILMVSNLALFLRMTQLQTEVINTLSLFKPPHGLEAGESAPAFALKDINDRILSLDSYSGDPILLVFSSTTCAACQEFWPSLQEFHSIRPDFPILMVSRGTQEENEQMVNEQHFDFPVLLWSEEVSSDYKIPGTPYLFLISDAQEIEFGGFASDLDRIATIVDE